MVASRPILVQGGVEFTEVVDVDEHEGVRAAERRQQLLVPAPVEGAGEGVLPGTLFGQCQPGPEVRLLGQEPVEVGQLLEGIEPLCDGEPGLQAFRALDGPEQVRPGVLGRSRPEGDPDVHLDAAAPDPERRAVDVPPDGAGELGQVPGGSAARAFASRKRSTAMSSPVSASPVNGSIPGLLRSARGGLHRHDPPGA